jgi:hypothetical protein
VPEIVAIECLERALNCGEITAAAPRERDDLGGPLKALASYRMGCIFFVRGARAKGCATSHLQFIGVKGLLKHEQE